MPSLSLSEPTDISLARTEACQISRLNVYAHEPERSNSAKRELYGKLAQGSKAIGVLRGFSFDGTFWIDCF